MSGALLDGIRVLDLTRVLSGPHCTRTLADLGADVVKIEGPEGDPSRYWGRRVDGVSAYYAQQNAGKRSVSIDLRLDDGLALCRSLADRADVIVENFRPGVMDRLGLGWAELSAMNPRLIYGSISGYGATGARASRKAYANMVAAQSGLLARQGEMFNGVPRPLPFNVADSCAGLELLSGILGALYHRTVTGRGQRVEVSMLHTLLSIDDMAAIRLWDPDDTFPDTGRVIATKDGWIATSPPGRMLATYARLMNRPDLLEDERFNSPRRADRHVEALRIEVEKWSMTLPSAEVLALLSEEGVACEAIVTTNDALTTERAAESGVVVELIARDGSPAPLVGSPISFSDAASRVGESAWRGQHNHVVVDDWLDGSFDVAALADSGALLEAHPKDPTGSIR